MLTINQYLIKPDGARYLNEKDGVIVNTTNDETDFKYVNRIGEVIAVPRDNYANLEVGDKVIVHHNTFRKWWNVRGLLKDSANFVKENTFQVHTDQLYAYNRGEGWKTVDDWIFVKPIENEYITLDNIGQYVVQTGIVKFANDHIGQEVFFDKKSEYKFEIDGEILYRMKERDIMLFI